MKCLLVSTLTYEIKFVGFPASITYLCYMYLITTFKILVIEYRLIYLISEFSYSLILVSASSHKSPHWLGPDLSDIFMIGTAQRQYFKFFTSITWSIFVNIYLFWIWRSDTFQTSWKRSNNRLKPCFHKCILMHIMKCCIRNCWWKQQSYKKTSSV